MKDVAFTLAHTERSEAVEEFKRILDSDWKEDWKTRLGLKPNYGGYYSYSEQLIVIEALGETRDPCALEYLENLISETEEIIGSKKLDLKIKTPSLDPIRHHSYEEASKWPGICFKNMRGYLRADLTLHPGDISDKNPTIPQYLEWVSERPEYQKIKESIVKLQNRGKNEN